MGPPLIVDMAWWAWCWLAYVVVIHVLPPGRANGLYMWLLPYAGTYGYNEGFDGFRESRRRNS